ncbi:MAG: class I SAM-dependent methyltransferase [Hyphomicrobiales bacterium]|nr:class I SAM-dependent methyltransferase [Hyphomicrobiales bacterium]MCP5001444.1 class I SAM-dependent methyltransferase [Hyphomicrobiales bacterium]
MDGTDEGPPTALFNFFERMPRQGPGSATVTAGIFNRVKHRLPEWPFAADMGCGSGAAGIVLAENGIRVCGVDIHLPFLHAFEKRAADAGVSDRVETLCVNMLDTGWPKASVDLIWSEGAVFTVGFDTALTEFGRLLKSSGVAVISEATWFQDPSRVPAELRAYWRTNYEGVRTVSGNLAAAEEQGWRFIHAERLADEVWETEFYTPMEQVIADVKSSNDADLKVIAAECETEIDLFRRFNAFYGYVYYVFERP